MSFAYTLDDEYGWVTASNPEKGLMIGYVWKAKDYPWLIDWRDVQNGSPLLVDSSLERRVCPILIRCW
ncbi:MAG: hypothetical protein DMG05_27710 [Acidobacteria bacterium]|nr:MAG: hypothetical protein DMG05_27710 [Acidobacteriota bacterium]